MMDVQIGILNRIGQLWNAGTMKRYDLSLQIIQALRLEQVKELSEDM